MMDYESQEVLTFLELVTSTLQSTGSYIDPSGIIATSMQSLPDNPTEDYIEWTSKILANHSTSIQDHIKNLFEMNPMIESIRDRHCHYNVTSVHTPGTAEQREVSDAEDNPQYSKTNVEVVKRGDVVKNVEWKMDEIIETLQQKAATERQTAGRTEKSTADALALLFEEEQRKLRDWKRSRKDDLLDDQGTAQIRQDLAVLHSWLRDVKTQSRIDRQTDLGKVNKGQLRHYEDVLRDLQSRLRKLRVHATEQEAKNPTTFSKGKGRELGEEGPEGQEDSRITQ